MRVLTPLGFGILISAACASESSDRAPVATPDAPPVEDVYVLATPVEVVAELETLGHELDDLERVVEAPSVPAGDAVRSLLSAARTAHQSAGGSIAAGDTMAAVDSLVATAERVEEVKRLLGLAEEWGVEIAPQSEP